MSLPSAPPLARRRTARPVRASSAILALSLLVAAGISCGDVSEPTVETVTPEDRGRELFFQGAALGRSGNLVSCSVCHADLDRALPGQSGAALARLAERPSYWGGQENDLLRSVNQCLYWFMGRAEPLAVGDPDGDDLFAYLVSIDGADSAAAAQPFTLGEVVWPGPGAAELGEVVYADACQHCHGARSTGEGALIPTSPVLPEETLAAHPDPEYSVEDRRLVFVEKVRHGPFLGYGGTMPPFSTDSLSDADLANLLTYLAVP